MWFLHTRAASSLTTSSLHLPESSYSPGLCMCFLCYSLYRNAFFLFFTCYSLKHPLSFNPIITSLDTTIKLTTPLCSVALSYLTLWGPHRLQPTRLLCPWDFPARILEWVSVSYSRGSSWPRGQTCISCVSYIGRRTLYHCTATPGNSNSFTIAWYFTNTFIMKSSVHHFYHEVMSTSIHCCFNLFSHSVVSNS